MHCFNLKDFLKLSFFNSHLFLLLQIKWLVSIWIATLSENELISYFESNHLQETNYI